MITSEGHTRSARQTTPIAEPVKARTKGGVSIRGSLLVKLLIVFLCLAVLPASITGWVSAVLGRSGLSSLLADLIAGTQEEMTTSGSELIQISRDTLTQTASHLTNRGAELALRTNAEFAEVSSALFKEAVLHRNLEVAKSLRDEIDRLLARKSTVLRLIAELPSIKGMDAEQQRHTINSSLRSFPAFREISTIGHDGREMAKVSRVRVLSATDLDDQSATPAFRAAMRGEPYLSPATFSPGARELSVIIGQPIELYSGRIIGAIWAEVSLSEIESRVLAVRQDTRRHAYVVAADGMVIIHPEPQKVVAGANLRASRAVQAVLAGEEGGRVSTDDSGVKTLSAFAPLKRLRWGVIVAQPMASLQAPFETTIGRLTTESNAAATGLKDASSRNIGYVTEAMSKNLGTGVDTAIASIRARAESETLATISGFVRTTSLIIAVSIAVFAFIGVLMARSIIRPVRRLIRGTEIVGRGDLTHRIEVRARDEIGQLAAAFNQMTAALRKSQETIQQRNEELEAMNEELRATNEELEAANEELQSTTQELEASNDELRRTTQELEQTARELRESQGRLLRTERLAAIGELSAGVAHELRNPLGAIKNAVYYIKGKLPGSDLVRENPRVGEFLEIMGEEVETCNQTITDLMDFARVNPPRLSPTNLETVVDNALSRLEIKKDVNVIKEFDTALPQVLADNDQLRRAFANLIKNADDAMPEGGNLTISVKVADGSVELEFCDTGRGISDDDLPKIFEPLFTTKPRGIGLGLAIAKQIVEKHAGSVSVTSEQEKGTTFAVRLPVNNG